MLGFYQPQSRENIARKNLGPLPIELGYARVRFRGINGIIWREKLGAVLSHYSLDINTSNKTFGMMVL